MEAAPVNLRQTSPARAPTAHLDEVARLLAEAILRARHRRLLKGIPPSGTPENQLEVLTTLSAHGARNGERP